MRTSGTTLKIPCPLSVLKKTLQASRVYEGDSGETMVRISKRSAPRRRTRSPVRSTNVEASENAGGMADTGAGAGTPDFFWQGGEKLLLERPCHIRRAP